MNDVLNNIDTALLRMDKHHVCSDGINHYEVLKAKRKGYLRGKMVVYDATEQLKEAIAFCGSLIPNINRRADGLLIIPKGRR